MPPNIDLESSGTPIVLEDATAVDTAAAPEEEVVVVTEDTKVGQEQPKPLEVDDDDDEETALEKDSSHKDMDETRSKGFVIIVACAAALGGLIFGYDIGGAGTLTV